MNYHFANRNELILFIQSEIVNTSEVMQMLNCSRQNVADLVRRGKLTPVKVMSKDTLYLRADIEARLKASE